MSLNENHRRRIYLTFKYLDQCLSNAAARLGGSDVDPMFPDHRPDATPAQRRAVMDCLRRLRAVMAGFLQSQAIPIREPGTGTVQAFHTTLTFAGITLEELAPKRLAGYGGVDKDAAREIQELVAEMRAILEEMSGVLEDDAARPP